MQHFSKTLVRTRCCICRRVVPLNAIANQKQAQVSPTKAYCFGCKGQCVVCNNYYDKTQFTTYFAKNSKATTDLNPRTRKATPKTLQFKDVPNLTCDRCHAMREDALRNAYFRYPMLKYKYCPVDEKTLKNVIHEEQQSKPK
eukprot:PhM_4_TR5239/c0_g1_i1/m.728